MSNQQLQQLCAWQAKLYDAIPQLFIATASYKRWEELSRCRDNHKTLNPVMGQHLFSGKYWLNVWEQSQNESIFSHSLFFSCDNIEYVALRLRDKPSYVLAATPYSIPFALLDLEENDLNPYIDTHVDVMGYMIDLKRLLRVISELDKYLLLHLPINAFKLQPCILHGLTNNLGHYIWNGICGWSLFCKSLAIDSIPDRLSYFSGNYDFLDIAEAEFCLNSENNSCIVASINIDGIDVSFVGSSQHVFVRPAAIFLSTSVANLANTMLDKHSSSLSTAADYLSNFSHVILFTLRSAGNRKWLQSAESILEVAKSLHELPNPLFIIDGLSTCNSISDSSFQSDLDTEARFSLDICTLLEHEGLAAISLVALPLLHKLPYYKRITIAIQPIGSGNIVPGWIYSKPILAFGDPNYVMLARKQQLNVIEHSSNVFFLNPAAVLGLPNGDISLDSSQLKEEALRLIRLIDDSSATIPLTLLKTSTYPVMTANIDYICDSCQFDPTDIIVLMPLKNDVKYLHEAILSIRDQIHRSWLLFVLDASDDDVADEIIGMHSRHDPRVHHLKFPPNSHPAERIDSFILAHADKCKYFAFHHSDDISYTIRLRDQVSFMDANPAIDISSSCYRSFIHDRYHEPRTGDGDFVHAKPLSHDHIVSQLPFWWVMHVPTLFFRSDIAQRTGYRFHSEYRLIGDYFANLRMYDKVRFGNIQQVLSAYRIHYLNDGYQNKKGLLEEEVSLIRYVLELIGAPTDDRSVNLHRSIKLLPGKTVHLESIGEYMELLRWLQLLKIYNKRSAAFPVRHFNRTVDYLCAMTCMSARDMFMGSISDDDAYNLRLMVQEPAFFSGNSLQSLNI